MSYATKYQVAFYDFYDQTVYAYLKKRDYIGVVTTLKAGDQNPPMIVPETGDDLLFYPINGTYISLKILEESFALLSELYTNDAREWLVELEIDGNPYWSGYLLPGEYSTPYNDVNHIIEIKAADQLGYLRNVKYDSMDEWDIHTPMEMLEKILVHTDLDLNLREAVNLYEDNMDDTVADSPLDQCWLDQGNYIEDEDTGEMKSCYDVLYDLLFKFTAIIRQVNGEWHIWRPTEALEGNYTRRLWTWSSVTNTFTYSSNAVHDPEVPTTAANVGLANLVRISNGARLSMITPWKQYRLKQVYGLRSSFLRNSKFDDWIDTTTPRHWTKGAPITVTQQGEKARITADTTFYVGRYLKQIVDITPIGTQKFRIQCKYYVKAYDAGSFHLMLKAVRLSDSTENWWDFDTEAWVGSQKYLSEVFAAGSKSVDLDIVTDNIRMFLSDYELHVFIHTPTCADTDTYVDVDYCKVTLVKTSGFEHEEYDEESDELVTVDDNNDYQPSDIEVLVADMPEEPGVLNRGLIWHGAIYLDVNRAEIADSWSDQGMGTSGLVSQSLIDWLKQKLSRQYSEQKQILNARIISNGIVGDSIIKEVNDDNKLYHINRGQYDLRNGVWNCELIEIGTEGEAIPYVVDKDSGSEEYIVMDSGGERVIV